MNKRTIKLLKRFAVEEGMNFRFVKRFWQSLSHAQRGETRRQMVHPSHAATRIAAGGRPRVLPKEAGKQVTKLSKGH